MYHISDGTNEFFYGFFVFTALFRILPGCLHLTHFSMFWLQTEKGGFNTLKSNQIRYIQNN